VLGEAGEPATKRPRLESVVPAPAPPPAKPVLKTPPPMPKPVAPPLWLSGQLPTSNKYSNNRDTGDYYGGGRDGGREGVGRGGRGGRGRGRGRGGGRARTSLCAEKEKENKEKERVYLRVPNKKVFDVCSKEILKHDILCES
jgi:hypothetical protein